MAITAFLSLLVALVGLVIYLFTNNKWAEIGRICFLAGLMVFLFENASRVVKF